MKVYPRKCDITNEGMKQGYCIQEGLMYIKYEKDLVQHLREIEPMQEELSDDFLLNDYYQNDYYYWTEWDELDDDVNYTIDGIEVCITEEEKNWNVLIPRIKKVKEQYDIFSQLDYECFVQTIEDAVWNDNIETAYSALIQMESL